MEIYVLYFIEPSISFNNQVLIINKLLENLVQGNLLFYFRTVISCFVVEVVPAKLEGTVEHNGIFTRIKTFT